MYARIFNRYLALHTKTYNDRIVFDVQNIIRMESRKYIYIYKCAFYGKNIKTTMQHKYLSVLHQSTQFYKGALLFAVS